METDIGTEPIRVLFVDDEERIVSLAATVLEDHHDGFAVHTETSGTAAVEYLDGEVVDCVVSDYRMPGMDGLALLDSVRETYPDLPFILSTAQGSEEAASEAISMGVTDYLRKGGTDQYGVLANRIENAVEKRRAQKALEDRERRLAVQRDELAAQRDELATLDRINVVVQGIVRGLVGAATREEIETTVCERIVTTDLYRSAWIAERDGDGGLAVETRVGVESAAGSLVADGGGLIEPGRRALETNTVQVFESRTPEARHDDPDDPRPVAVVPLSYRDVVYGVLGVSATRPNAFSNREVAGFAVLGEVAGFAINAAQNMKLLLSDTAVALTLRVVEESAFPVALTRRLGCTYSLDGVVPAADDTMLQYGTVEGATPEAVGEFAGECSGVVECRLVTETDEGGVFEFATHTTPVNTVIEVGGTVRELVAEGGEARLVCEVAADADVRRVVDAVERVHPGTQLVSKRAVSLPLENEREFRRSVGDHLTEKQRAAVRAAYFAGYYDWPRGSTAEEVAASMGVSSPTLHSHLRKAHRKLLAAFLGSDG